MLYKNEFAVNVEIWDTAGEEKFNEKFTYTQNFLQGKQGIILLVDGIDFMD